ncbi:hypothetical protein A2G06_16915 (plasmid) [Geobacter anodireducens]|nr:hypothetical protein A2G06_16915 [Geobacter anodireducens]
MVQLSLDFSSPPLKPALQVSKPVLTDWQRVLALPVVALANAWVAMTGSGKHPCKTCGKKGPCAFREGCIAFEAYQAGLGWRFGEIDFMEATPVAIARSGGFYEGVHR